jgi:hypothetical protein
VTPAVGRTSIDEALDRFLTEQEQRLSERTFRNYVDVVGLFRDCMNGYGYNRVPETESERW